MALCITQPGLCQPTGDKPAQLGFVPHTKAMCFPAVAYHGENDQGREEAHDNVAHQLHQLVPATDREAAWRKRGGGAITAGPMSSCVSHTTAAGLAPCSGGDGPPPWLGSCELSSGPGAWGFEETSGAFCFLFGATMWTKQLMAARPPSHIPPPTSLPPKLLKPGCGWGRTWSKEALHCQSTRRLPRDPVPVYRSICLSTCILLALPSSLATIGPLGGAGRAELDSAIPTSTGPGKGTHRSWKKKT